MQSSVKGPSGMRHHSRIRLPKPRQEHRHLNVPDPLVKESLHRSVSQQNRLSCIGTPTKAKSHRSSATPPLETRQRRTLSRFTKELERYCVAASANGRVPLLPSTPTVSESPTTLDTVTELLPYHKQFKVAGLAVTSHEQMPRIPESAHPQPPLRQFRRVKGAQAAAVQIDGSTVTPSDQASITQEPSAPVVPSEKASDSYNHQPTAPALQSQPRPINKSLLPWSLKQNPSHASTAHSGRRFSKDHLHPSQATPAEPVLTPSGPIDSYFESPQLSKPKDEQVVDRNNSSSAISSTVSSRADKPLPKQPPVTRRPIPPRSDRRHMENTAEWPTAGTLIHDNAPPPPNQAESTGIFQDVTALADDSKSVQSWSTIEDDLPDEPERSPPVPPKETKDTIGSLAEAGCKPDTPPKDDPPGKLDNSQVHRHHPGHSLYNKWMKATCMRRRASVKPLLMPTTIREESETRVGDTEQPHQAGPGPNDAPPQIPIKLDFPVEASSSFERALDAVISKLDAMEERRRYERKMDLEAARQALNKTDTSQRACSKPASPKQSAQDSQHEESDPAAETVSSTEAAMEYSDKDINDRDILLGLKMAICAACDEDLDAWICSKTGLRLRRFLADLKAFESVSQDQEAVQPFAMSRRIRKGDQENRRLQAAQQRGYRNLKSWSPCFSGDGQGFSLEPSDKASNETAGK